MRIDLHRHLGGSIRPETVWHLMQSDSTMRNIADSIDDLYGMMTFRNDRTYKFHHFLGKFEVLNYIRWTEVAIDYTIEQIIRDLYQEGIDYCELRFSIDKYLNYIPWDEHEACLFVLSRIAKWSKHYNVRVGPVLSIKHETSFITMKRLSKLINHWRVAEQIVGIDIVGNEGMFNRKRLRDIFRYWRLCGKGILIHAGETQTPDNVRCAIEYLKVHRIAHGIKIVDDQYIMDLAHENGIVFDVAVTSNMMTGVVQNMNNHPIKRMIEHGLICTVGTDDPVTFDITIDQELQVVANVLDVPIDSSLMDHIRRNSEVHALSDLSQI